MQTKVKNNLSQIRKRIEFDNIDLNGIIEFENADHEPMNVKRRMDKLMESYLRVVLNSAQLKQVIQLLKTKKYDYSSPPIIWTKLLNVSMQKSLDAHLFLFNFMDYFDLWIRNSEKATLLDFLQGQVYIAERYKRYFHPRIEEAIIAIHHAKDSTLIYNKAIPLLRDVFGWILAADKKTTLTELLKCAWLKEPVMERYMQPIKIWLKKIWRKIPFTGNEGSRFKKLLFFFLHDLKLLPQKLVDYISLMSSFEMARRSLLCPPLPNPFDTSLFLLVEPDRSRVNDSRVYINLFSKFAQKYGFKHEYFSVSQIQDPSMRFQLSHVQSPAIIVMYGTNYVVIPWNTDSLETLLGSMLDGAQENI